MPEQTAIAAIPWSSPEEIALSPFGVALEDPCYVGEPLEWVSEVEKDSRGIGIAVPNDGRIRGSVSQHCYIGAKLGSSDSRITDSDVFNHRDACLWIARDAGNCQSTASHFYGSRIAVYNEGGWQYRSTADTIADAILGALCDAQSKFTAAMSQHCYVRNFVLRGGDCELNGCTVNVQLAAKEITSFNVPGFTVYSGLAGIEIVGDGARIRGGHVVLTNWIHPLNTASGNAAIGIILGASDCIIDTNLIDGDGLDGSTGIYIPGQRHNIVINSNTRGFHDQSARILDMPGKYTALDITLRMDGFKKPIGDYIDLAPGWTGSIRLIDTSTGKVHSLTEGRAA